MTQEDIYDLVKDGHGIEKDICQICVIKAGEMVYRENWRRYKKDSTIHVMSVTKGIMAILTGIAVDKGYIHSTKQKVLEFFPSHVAKIGQNIIGDVTLEHLLTMTVPYRYRSEPWKRVCSTSAWSEAALDMIGGREGFTGRFRYATLGLQVLSGIIENAVGKKCIDFANENLFVPLGIPEHAIHTPTSELEYRSFLMSKKAGDNEWYADPGGTVTAGWGLTLSACDMAKIGWMLANGGKYGESEILSGEWIRQMTAPILPTGDNPDSYYYGYLWYRPNRERNIFAAIGTGGNLIYVDDEKKISVGVTGTSRLGMENNINFIEGYVIPLW